MEHHHVSLGMHNRQLVSGYLASCSSPQSMNHSDTTRSKQCIGVVDNAAQIKEELCKLTSHVNHASMQIMKSTLPAHIHRIKLIETINHNSVTLLRGATGCGKSTQVPQLLLEDAADRGLSCRIVCAQPRRLAATALAKRVASELCDDSAGGICGYRIRGESKVSPRTAVTFVTTGILLRQLEDDPNLSSLTHIVVDEVHERSVDVDLLLLALRRMLHSATAESKLPRIILMSATMDATAFLEYFNFRESADTDVEDEVEVGLCDVPGRTFPVDEFFLEEAVYGCGYICRRDSGWARHPSLPQAPSISPAVEALAAAAAAAEALKAAQSSETPNATVIANLQIRSSKLNNAASAASASSKIGASAGDFLRAAGVVGTEALFSRMQQEHSRRSGASLSSPAVAAASLRAMELSVVNEDLVEALVLQHHYSSDGGGGGGDGAVLVFLPGAFEIEQLRLKLQSSVRESGKKGGQKSGKNGKSGGLLVLPLHSQLSTTEQGKVFLPPPRGEGMTKVVLATDIAETSVTIPDVTLVIDGGLHRSMSCDKRTGSAHLRTSRISQAAAKQRAGRAGRVRAGRCYHLYCRVESEGGTATATGVGAGAGAGAAGTNQENQICFPASMEPAPSAEILCVPLESLLLRVRVLLPGSAHLPLLNVLAQVLTPPEASAVARAITSLVDLGALQLAGVAGVTKTATATLTAAPTAAPIKNNGSGDGSSRRHCEVLTPLGRKLASLPIDPHIGKALVCAVTLSCLSPVALLAAWLTAPRDPFGRGSSSSSNSSSDRKDASSGSSSSSRSSEAVGPAQVKRSLDAESDHAACIRAHAEWHKEKNETQINRTHSKAGHNSKEYQLQAFIHQPAMKDVERTANRLIQETLQACGHRYNNSGGSGGGGGGSGGGGGGGGGGIGGGSSASTRWYDANMANMALVKCCLLSGLHSHVMRIERKTANASNRHNAMDAMGKYRLAPWQLRWRVKVDGARGSAKKKGGGNSPFSEQILKPHKSSIYSISSSGGPAGGDTGNVISAKKSANGIIAKDEQAKGKAGKGKGKWKSKSKNAAAVPAAATSTPAATPSKLCVCFGVLSTARGAMALDVTMVSPLAVLMFGGEAKQHVGDPNMDAAPTVDESGESKSKSTTVVDVGTEQFKLSQEDAAIALQLRGRISAALGEGAASTVARSQPSPSSSGSGAGIKHTTLGGIVAALLPSLDAPWSGLPAGWVYEEGALGKALYRALHEPSLVIGTKPRQTALEVVEHAKRVKQVAEDRREAEKTSAERRKIDREAQKKRETKAENSSAKEKPSQQTETEKQEGSAAKEKEKLEVRAFEEKQAQQRQVAQAEKAKEQAVREKSAAAQMKAATLARVAAAEAENAKSAERNTVAWSVRAGMNSLLSELELLDRYGSTFESAGYGNAMLADIAETIDLERAGDAEEGEGVALVEKLIKETGLRGGSAAKIRRRLLEYKTGTGSQDGHRGWDKGKGTGSGKAAGDKDKAGKRKHPKKKASPADVSALLQEGLRGGKKKTNSKKK